MKNLKNFRRSLQLERKILRHMAMARPRRTHSRKKENGESA